MKDSIKNPAPVVTGSDVLTTTHTITSASAVRVGRLYVVNLTVALTSNVSAWGKILTLKNIHMPDSQYAFGYAGASGADLFYIGGSDYSGDLSCTRSLSSGTTIKVSATLILDQ